MEIKGKNVVFLGDSITEGVGASAYENCYVSVFEGLTGCKAYNYGVSATRIAKQKEKFCEPPLEENFIERADRMPNGMHLVVVFGGTNDFGHGDAPLGSFDDRTDDTFYGALHVLYKKLIEKYPLSKIVVLTPLHRLTENYTVNERGVRCEPLSRYVAAEKEVAEYYSLPVLDLWSLSGIQPAVPVIQQTYMPDGLHPNDNGARVIAEKLVEFVKIL